MIDLYFWNTPNGYKPLLLLEELGLDYGLHTIHIGEGQQKTSEFLKISPNGRIPAIIDQDTGITMMESGAILEYLAEKTDQFRGDTPAARAEVRQWLMWQMGGLGPMMGQAFHFKVFAETPIPYAIDRYVNETKRLLGVMDARLADRDYLAGDYSIADMMCYPWAKAMSRLEISEDDFPKVRDWVKRIDERPATARAYEKGEAAAEKAKADA